MVQPANKRLVTEAALPEAVRAVVEASFVAGSGVTITHNGEANTITIAATGAGGLDLEQIQDAVAAMIVEGSGLSAVYDDTAGTYTLTATGGGGGLDLESVQDAVAAMVVEGSGLTATYDDTSGTYTISLADTTIVSHTFTGADSPTTVPAPEIGPAGVTSTGSVAGTRGNKMYFSTGVNNDYSMRTFETNKADVVVEVDIPNTPGTDWPGIVVRSASQANDDNCYLILHSGAWKHLAGVESSMGGFTGVVAGDRLRVIVNSYSLKAYRRPAAGGQWVLLEEYVLSGDHLTNTKHGIAEYDADSSGADYDNLWIGTLTPKIEAEARVADLNSKVSIYTVAETIRDTIAAALVPGTNVTITPDDTANTITIAAGSGLDAEAVQDLVATMVLEGTGLTATYDDTAGTYTISSTVVDTNTTDPEVVRDTMAAALVAGANVTITPDDTANTITIAATGGGGGLDTEAVQDAVAAMILESSPGLIATYDDTAGTYTISLNNIPQGTVSDLVADLGDKADFNFVRTADMRGMTRANLDRVHDIASRIGGGQAQMAYENAVEITEDWGNLNGVLEAANAQVVGNKFYAVNATAPGGFTKDIVVPATGRWRLQTLYYHKAGGAQSAYFGVSCDAPGTAIAANDTDGIYIGMSSSNARNAVLGSALSGAGVTANGPATLGASPTADTTYLVTIDADDVFITLTMKAVGVIGDVYTWRVRRDQLATAGKTIRQIACYITDSRGSAGSGFGPFILSTGSIQPTRTKTLGGQLIEGADFRIRTTAGSTAYDPSWFYVLPKSYDPRRPSPVVMWAHHSLTGVGWDFLEETRAQPVAQALLDAGYIIAGITTSSDMYGNEVSQDSYLDLYRHLRDTFNTGPLLWLGVSMGTLDVANSISRKDWPTPAAAVGIAGAYDIDHIISLGGGYPAAVYAAYNTNAAGIAAAKVGYDPIEKTSEEYRGVPWKLYSSSGDTAQPIAKQNEFAALVGVYAPEATVVDAGAVAHLDPAQYQASNVLAFFKKYIEFGATLAQTTNNARDDAPVEFRTQAQLTADATLASVPAGPRPILIAIL